MCAAPPPLFTHNVTFDLCSHCVNLQSAAADAKTEAKQQKKRKNRAPRYLIPSVTSFAILAIEEATDVKTETTVLVEETAPVAKKKKEKTTKKESGSVAAPCLAEVEAPKSGEKKNGVIGLFLAATMVCAGVGAAGVGGDWAIGVPAVETDALETWAWSPVWDDREEEQESLAGAVRVLGEKEEQAVEPIQ